MNLKLLFSVNKLHTTLLEGGLEDSSVNKKFLKELQRGRKNE